MPEVNTPEEFSIPVPDPWYKAAEVLLNDNPLREHSDIVTNGGGVNGGEPG